MVIIKRLLPKLIAAFAFLSIDSSACMAARPAFFRPQRHHHQHRCRGGIRHCGPRRCGRQRRCGTRAPNCWMGGHAHRSINSWMMPHQAGFTHGAQFFRNRPLPIPINYPLPSRSSIDSVAKSLSDSSEES